MGILNLNSNFERSLKLYLSIDGFFSLKTLHFEFLIWEKFSFTKIYEKYFSTRPKFQTDWMDQSIFYKHLK